MEIKNKNDGVQPVADDSREPESTIPEAASNLPLKRTARPRKDKAEFHATKHGILARPLLGALARRGENIRQLRVIERMLREKLQINGIFAELLFDRAWSSFLRCLLIARTEARVLTSEGPPSDLSFIPNLPKLPKSDFSFDDVSVLRLHQIALIQRTTRIFPVISIAQWGCLWRCETVETSG